jgi:hypothetical protein
VNICFLLGPHRSGKCGISDYVDLLGQELERRGHSVQQHSIESPNDFESISKDLPLADLYSLQFAPYAFSRHGISGRPLFRFGHALRGKKTQLNFHEIWIGAYPRANFKEYFIGWRQRREILKFINISRPSVIHATNSATIDRLRKEGVHADYQYLFGNIPFSTYEHEESNQPSLRIVFFGTLYDSFPYQLMGRRLQEIDKLSAKTIELRIIGRQREDSGLNSLRKMSEDHEFPILLTGELAAEEVSREFQFCSIGVSTTPYDVMGKSGATAAMLEHGLPVLAYDDEDTPADKLFVFESFKDQVFLLNNEKSCEQIIQFLQNSRKPFFDGIDHVASKMEEVIY